jgi:hypothetical protein
MASGWIGLVDLIDWIALVDLLGLVLEESEQIDLFEGVDRQGGLVEIDHFRVCGSQMVVPLRLFVSALERLHRIVRWEVQVQFGFQGIYSVPS